MGQHRYSLKEPALVAAEMHTLYDDAAILELIHWLLDGLPPERYQVFLWRRGTDRDPERVKEK